MSNYITRLLKENYILNQPNIAVDFQKFLKKESNVLLIVGFSGSGKTTLGKKLSEKYKCKFMETDRLWEENNLERVDDPELRSKIYKKMILDVLNSKQRVVFEGLHLVSFYKFYCNLYRNEDIRNILMSKPVITPHG